MKMHGTNVNKKFHQLFWGVTEVRQNKHVHTTNRNGTFDIRIIASPCPLA